MANIRSYRERENATVILVSHSMEDIALNADRVMVLSEGRIRMFDSTAAVYSRGEELLAMGLDVPQITRVFLALRERGYDVSPSVLSPEQAIGELIRCAEEVRNAP